MNDELDLEFSSICKKITEESANPDNGEVELESFYTDLLEFMIRNLEHRQHLVTILIEIVKQYRTAKTSRNRPLPGRAIAFAMHELRWREILDFANAENWEYYAKFKGTTMQDIIDAYEDDWEDALFYERYKNHTSP